MNAALMKHIPFLSCNQYTIEVIDNTINLITQILCQHINCPTVIYLMNGYLILLGFQQSSRRSKEDFSYGFAFTPSPRIKSIRTPL